MLIYLRQFRLSRRGRIQPFVNRRMASTNNLSERTGWPLDQLNQRAVRWRVHPPPFSPPVFVLIGESLAKRPCACDLRSRMVSLLKILSEPEFEQLQGLISDCSETVRWAAS
jgi:hypothetical protein